MIKTFRGLLLDGEQDKIRLSTKKGKIGYRIVKFQVMENEPGDNALEGACKIFKILQTSVTNTVDFSDGNLLAAADYNKHGDTQNAKSVIIIFDQEIFNQDIYVTWKDNTSDEKINYYLELEVMTLSDNAAAVSTLRDIRLNPQVGA